ncbi:Fig4 [Symbiodinium natans]|uniref:Fig4 protein n=1 Tax=Symbiodinium natans TaxID=878477 RepID=A0A812PE41_9DINO|nr:Fig4 [Symbiodinium natans]
MCDVLGPPSFVCPFQRYHVYRSKSAVFVFGIDKVQKEYSCLQIPKQEDSNSTLELREGEERHELAGLQARVADLRQKYGLEEVALKASGLVGFIRFLCGHYLILIKTHKKVGKIGRHHVLSIESTTLVPLFGDSSKREEKNFKDQLNNLNLSKDFYFSYSYELSRTVQQNLADAKCAARGQLRPLYVEKDATKHHRFVWNHHHMMPFFANERWQHWCLSIIHGFFAHTKCSSFGWTFEVALIARRSRFYAGTRYRKRGLNVDGQVGNDVETEQLLCDDSLRHLSTGHVMSFVQIRGSVPLFWSQEATAINPKPPVVYPRCDPTLSATRRHFADLLERYGTPQLVVNLMKAKKVDSYEVRLSKNFESAIERMNRELPEKHRILYRPFDMKNHAKSNPTIYEVFARLAESVVTRVGFFHTKAGLQGQPERLQNGVVRTNCVDCLDRTNVLQFFVGLEVLKQQLTAMCLLPEPKMDFESQAVFVLSELYDVMGDHLALQYAGSVAHKKYQLLGSRPRMMTSSKELLTSIHRHYNNSFTDREKQACLNLFLGLYQPSIHPSMEKLDCDSWVHHKVLKDDYSPGEWWVEPLEKHRQNLLPLQAKDPEYNTMLTQDRLQKWFCQVHKPEKYTWFEKLLANSDATFVQINPANRPLRTVGPYKKYLERKQKEAKQNDAPASKPSFSLQPMSAEETEVYQTYVDTKQLSRLLWLESTAVDQDPECNTMLTQDGLQKWFCQVHKAEKYTGLEKPNADATFVQAKINPANRPLRTVGPYKTYLERKQKEAKQSDAPASKPSFSLQPMSAEETEVYQTYVDTKQLSRLLWLESTAVDQVLDTVASRARQLVADEVSEAAANLSAGAILLDQTKSMNKSSGEI